MNAVFLAWEKYHARTELLARALGARVHYQYRLGRVKGPRLLLKYLLQAVDTVRTLWRERPSAVIVQTPPVFPALLAVLYAALVPGTRVILDAHSGTFLSSKWTWALPVQRWCARRAALTIVHMPSLRPLVAAWGARVMELGYVFEPSAPPAEAYPLAPGHHIAVPSSFNADEPLDLIYAAAALLPDVTFHLTGDARRLAPAQLARQPANVHFTGYLSTPAYHGLLLSADAVLALTTQDQTFQTGGAEAAWLGRPLIISDWPELRKVFAPGAVFVANTPDGLAAGVRLVQSQAAALQQGMDQVKRKFDHELSVKLRQLQALLEASGPSAPAPLREWAADKER